MDVFFEQLVPIPKSGKIILLQSLMWFAGILLALMIFFASALFGLQIIGFGAMCGILYLCWMWSGKLSCEFEYIFTNGDLDIDKIIAKQKRERKITIDVETTEKLFKYSENAAKSGNYSKVIYACVPDEESVCLVARHKKEGLCLLVFAPEEKLLSKIKEFIPRNILRASEI